MPSTGDDAVEGYFLDSVSANAPDALCERLAAFAALLLAEEADFAFFRLLHCCQRNHLQAHPTQCFAAGLEALLNADTRTDGMALRLTANVHQAFERFAVGKKIINQQHTLSLFQTTFANVDGAGRLVGEGEHISGIHIVAKVAALTLFGDNDGQVAHRQCSGHGKDDAAGFDGEDAVNLVIAESVRERLPNMACEGGINAVVEEALDADNAAGEDVTVLKNALLKFLHGVIPAFFADFYVDCNCCVSVPG
jgi:hypothetical protein